MPQFSYIPWFLRVPPEEERVKGCSGLSSKSRKTVNLSSLSCTCQLLWIDHWCRPTRLGKASSRSFIPSFLRNFITIGRKRKKLKFPWCCDLYFMTADSVQCVKMLFFSRCLTDKPGIYRCCEGVLQRRSTEIRLAAYDRTQENLWNYINID